MSLLITIYLKLMSFMQITNTYTQNSNTNFQSIPSNKKNAYETHYNGYL